MCAMGKRVVMINALMYLQLLFFPRYHPDSKRLGYNANKVSGAISNFCYFDNLFFNTSPREAFAMDPHQHQVGAASVKI